MENKKQITRKQHTIPRFLLENFAFEGKVVIADFKTKRVFKTIVKKATVKKDFYENDKSATNFIEDNLASIEFKAAPIIKKLVATDDDVKLTNIETNTLIIFLETLVTRTISPFEFDKNPAKDIFEHWGKNAYDFSKEAVHDDLLEFMKLDFNRLITDYRKQRRTWIANPRMLKKLRGGIVSEYEHWDYRNKYSMRIFRSVIDLSKMKVFIINTTDDINVIGSTFGTGQRGIKSQSVYYYEFPISSRKSIIMNLGYYDEPENNLHELAMKSKQLSFKLDNVIKQHTLGLQEFFMSTIYKYNEEKSFIITNSYNLLFDNIKHLEEYVNYTRTFMKTDYKWACYYIMENLDEEYKKEADRIREYRKKNSL